MANDPANNNTFDNFITFIDAKFYQVIQKIFFNGKDPTGNNILANGIEQCIFNPRDGNFYLNIPNTGPVPPITTPPTPAGPGVTLVISGTAPFTILKKFDFAQPPLSSTGCTGSTGIALGPDSQLALSCGLIINDQTGAPIATFPAQGGADEMWFNPGSNHYFFADSTPAHLGIIDAGPPPSADLFAVTAVGSHSVAADSLTNQVYVPIRGNNAVANSGTTCSKANDVFGLPGSDAFGCILSYIAPSDSDDVVASNGSGSGNGNGNGKGNGNGNGKGQGNGNGKGNGTGKGNGN